MSFKATSKLLRELKLPTPSRHDDTVSKAIAPADRRMCNLNHDTWDLGSCCLEPSKAVVRASVCFVLSPALIKLRTGQALVSWLESSHSFHSERPRNHGPSWQPSQTLRRTGTSGNISYAASTLVCGSRTAMTQHLNV